MREWQLIDTAPKDGREVELWCPKYGMYLRCRWQDDYWTCERDWAPDKSLILAQDIEVVTPKQLKSIFSHWRELDDNVPEGQYLRKWDCVKKSFVYGKATLEVAEGVKPARKTTK